MGDEKIGTLDIHDRGELLSATPPIYIASGGTGASAEKLLDTVLVQFPDTQVPVITIAPVRQPEQIENIVTRASKTGGTIVHTLIDDGLRNALIQQAQKQDVANIDLIGPLLTKLSDVLGQKPLGHPGLYRQLHQAYFDRVDAIEFTMAHDDGLNPRGWPLAEIMLVGVSRVGKTPLSVYLSVLGWKVANVPIILETPVPKGLFQLDPRRVIGLDIESNHLMLFRQQRLKRMGIKEPMDYINPSKINEELESARQFFQKGGFNVIEITDKTIETSANEVIELITQKLKSESHRQS